MEIIILAAGFGTRLGEIGKDKAKCLVSFLDGYTTFDRICKDIEIDGIRDHVSCVKIVTNNKYAHQFNAHLANAKVPYVIINNQVNRVEESKGAISDLLLALNPCSDTVIIAPDNYWEDGLQGFLTSCIVEKDDAVIGVKDLEDLSKVSQYGVVEINQFSKVIGFDEKPRFPRSSVVLTGALYIPRCIVNTRDFKDLRLHTNLGNLMHLLMTKTMVHPYHFLGKWFDIGTIDMLQQVALFHSQLLEKLSKKSK